MRWQLAVLVLLLLAPTAVGLKAAVPAAVQSGQVPIVVTEAAVGDTVRVTVGATERLLPGGNATRSTSLAIANGMHPWRVEVVGNPASAVTGWVYVDLVTDARVATAQGNLTTALARIQAIDLELDQLAASLTTVRSGVGRLEANGSADLAQLRRNVASLDSALSNVSAAAQALQEAIAVDSAAARRTLAALQADLANVSKGQQAARSSAVEARGAGLTASWVGAFGAVTLLAATAYLWFDTRRLHKDVLVLLLANSARMGLTEDGEEIRRAQEVVGMRP